MACESIEQELKALRDELAIARDGFEMLPDHKKPLVQANIDRIEGEIAREEANLADCLADAAPPAGGNTLLALGFVGTVEVDTKNTSRVWFGLTESKDKPDWVKIGSVRAWFTLNLEAADRPFYLAELALIMEAMREGQHVEVGHGGAVTTLEKWDPNDSFEVKAIRLARGADAHHGLRSRTVPDTSIVATPLPDGRVSYTLGPADWADRRIPDIRRPGHTVQVAEDRVIDVIILGDGFTAQSQFTTVLVDWLAKFQSIDVYATFAGCLRIRALYTPSVEPASSSRGSFYGCLMTSGGRALTDERDADGDGENEDYDWWSADDADGRRFRQRFWAGVDTFAIATQRRYPLDLDVGADSQAINNDSLRGRYRNLVVSMLVRSSIAAPPGVDVDPSGFVREVPRPAPDDDRFVGVAFGASEIHEFSHAFGLLGDEYINERGATSSRTNPTTASVFTLSNLVYSGTPRTEPPGAYETPTVDETPWLHLSPGGWQTRTAGGQNPPPLLGWLWVGGSSQHRVWHSEYRCLMNGGHENFTFTQDADEDPTAGTDNAYDPKTDQGAGLRDEDRLCLWCQELVTLRILEKTDQLLESNDPADVTTQGIVWYDRWVNGLRDNYYALFGVARQIADTEARYAATFPGRAGEPLWRSDLYSVPTAATVAASTPTVPPLSDDETFLLSVLTALP